MKERKFLIRNVKKARDLINGKLKITQKDESGDLVTNFDTLIEKFLIKKFKRTYPDFKIVSEELNGDKKLTKNCFVIDPIDGTNNFARKIPIWGIQIACIKNGKVVASVIYLPIYEELYSADESGAYLNDEKIKVNDQNEKLGVYTLEQNIPNSYQIATKNPNTRRFGSSAFSLAMVACGKTSSAMFRDTIHPWDIIPGEYLVRKAGGVSFTKNHVRVCANSLSWSNLLDSQEEPKQPEIPDHPKKPSPKIAPSPKNRPKPFRNPIQINQGNRRIDSPKKTNPGFYLEQSETILETFSYNLPKRTSLAKPVPKKPIQKSEQNPKIKQETKTSTIKPSLTEARKRKIIM